MQIIGEYQRNILLLPSNLKTIQKRKQKLWWAIKYCFLFPYSLLPHLQNLNVMDVKVMKNHSKVKLSFYETKWGLWCFWVKKPKFESKLLSKLMNNSILINEKYQIIRFMRRNCNVYSFTTGLWLQQLILCQKWKISMLSRNLSTIHFFILFNPALNQNVIIPFIRSYYILKLHIS